MCKQNHAAAGNGAQRAIEKVRACLLRSVYILKSMNERSMKIYTQLYYT